MGVRTFKHEYNTGDIVYAVGGCWFWVHAYPVKIRGIEFYTYLSKPVYLGECEGLGTIRRSEHELFKTKSKAEESFMKTPKGDPR